MLFKRHCARSYDSSPDDQVLPWSRIGLDDGNAGMGFQGLLSPQNIALPAVQKTDTLLSVAVLIDMKEIFV